MGNVTHDYYQMPLVPIGCYFMAKGFDFLLRNGKNFLAKVINIAIALTLVVLMLAFGWYEVRGYFNINRWEIVDAGREIDRLIPKDAKVIAPYNRDPAFLYQTNRNGWSGLRNMEELKDFVNQGATYYASVDFDDITIKLMRTFQTVEKTDKFVIINLQNCL